jgi:hypothetical protein
MFSYKSWKTTILAVLGRYSTTPSKQVHTAVVGVTSAGATIWKYPLPGLCHLSIVIIDHFLGLNSCLYSTPLSHRGGGGSDFVELFLRLEELVERSH